MHVQCVFQYDANPKGQPAACVGCGSKIEPPRRVLSRFGKPGARCTPATSAPLYYCFTCTCDFVQRHRDLLIGWLGAEQSEAAVAWRSAGPFAASSNGGPPALPKDKKLRADFLACFRFDPPQSQEDAATACLRHHALQQSISEALKQDRERVLATQESAHGGEAPSEKRHASTSLT